MLEVIETTLSLKRRTDGWKAYFRDLPKELRTIVAVSLETVFSQFLVGVFVPWRLGMN